MTDNQATCPLCRSTLGHVIQLNEFFRVLQCVSCKLGLLDPQPNPQEVTHLYQDGNYYAETGPGYTDYSGQEKTLRLTFRKLIARVTNHLEKTNSVLEIGCGFGFFLDEIKDLFTEVVGTEMDPNAVQHARELGIQVNNSSLENFETSQNWDLVAMIQVIEHIVDPEEAIIKMKRLLSPNGSLLLVTPDFDSPLRHLLKKKWPSYKIPEHLYYFNKESMGFLLKKCGAKTVDWIPYPHAFPMNLLTRNLGLNLNSSIGNIPVWIPRTSIAALAKFD